VDNIPRMLPKSCKAVIDRANWPTHPIFSFLRKAGHISDQEMTRTFNNGIGLVIAVGPEDTHNVIEDLKSMGDTAYYMGTVESKNKEEAAVQFKNQK
jgi:phosphoribosylformylglycinamidine cyclo-ligase